MRNKAPRRKQRGIKSAFQAAGFQPAFAPRGEELNPVEIKSFQESKHLPTITGLIDMFPVV